MPYFTLPSREDGVLLEGRVDYQPGTSISSSGNISAPLLILTHPYGPLGGRMNNNVTNTLFKHFLSAGWMALAFSFRGCGRSKGRTSWTGGGEINDLESIITAALTSSLPLPEADPIRRIRPNRLLLIGYSYGGIIALATILKEPSSLRPETPTSLVLISYPASVAWALTLGHSPASLPPPEIPVMCVYGSNDQFSSRTTYRKWWARLGDGSVASHHRALLCIPHADHIWMGMEARLAGEIDGWLSLLSPSE